MKKMSLMLALLIGFVSSSFAAEATKTVSGTIGGVTVGNVWALKVVSYAAVDDPLGNGTGTTALDADALFEILNTRIGSGTTADPYQWDNSGNLQFAGAILEGRTLTSPAGTATTNTFEIDPTFVDKKDTDTLNPYKTTAHCAAPIYTALQMFVDNNATSAYQVDMAVTWSWLATQNAILPSTQTSSAMHVTTGLMHEPVDLDGNGTIDFYLDTKVPTNLKGQDLVDASLAMPAAGTPVSLYVKSTGTEVQGDLFWAYASVDFLSTDVASGTYSGGTVEYTLTDNN